MSCNLGPIHHWIYEQVRRTEARSKHLVEILADAAVAGVESAWDEIVERHPGEYEGTELESLIGETVHESVEAFVSTVEAREAALWSFAHERGDEARNRFAEAYVSDGRRCGERTREATPEQDARAIFASLRELWLEGMPCNVEIDLPADTGERVEWTRQGLPLARYWSLSPALTAELAALHCGWIRAFVEGCGDGYRLECVESPADPEAENRFRIVANDASPLP